MMREILESRSSELLLIKFKSEVSDGPQETLWDLNLFSVPWLDAIILQVAEVWTPDAAITIPAVCPGGWTL